MLVLSSSQFVKVCGWRPHDGGAAHAGGRRTQTSKGDAMGRRRGYCIHRRAMRAKSNDTAHNFSCHPCFGCLLLHLVPFVGKIVSLPEQTDVYLIKPHDSRACPH